MSKKIEMEFEWDENENLKNKEKHKIDFEEAKTIFDDSDAIELEASRNGEYRIIRIGKRRRENNIVDLKILNKNP